MAAVFIVAGSLFGVGAVYYFGIKLFGGIARSDEFERQVRERHSRDRG